MKRKTGMICMILGATLILGALLLFLHNRYEEKIAAEEAAKRLEQLLEQMEENKDDNDRMLSDNLEVPEKYLDSDALEMREIEINGHRYIGYLGIPSLGLELPVMSEWDYEKLRIAPCRYYGSIRAENMVLMAHNYAYHFGHIADLTLGDKVSFADVLGIVTEYEVVGKDVLSPYAVEEMTSGDYDLTLFTCTYGGKSRVTVYCDRIK